MNSRRWLLLSLFLLFVLYGAPLQAQNNGAKLLGKWQTTEKVGEEELTIIMELSKKDKENLLKVTVKDTEVDGRFKVEGNKLDISVLNNGVEKKEKLTFELKDDQLTLTDSKNKKKTFTRVKAK